LQLAPPWRYTVRGNGKTVAAAAATGIRNSNFLSLSLSLSLSRTKRDPSPKMTTEITYGFVRHPGVKELVYHGFLQFVEKGKVIGIQHAGGRCEITGDDLVKVYQQERREVVTTMTVTVPNFDYESVWGECLAKYNENSSAYPNCCYGLADMFVFYAGGNARDLYAQMEQVEPMHAKTYVDRANKLYNNR
jgi:hypothetical protein